jgi:diguanylate cyclase (GGDEF)-like protein
MDLERRHFSAERAELSRQVMHDPLTGLANRRLFVSRLAEEHGRSQRYGQPLALAAIDIDHFKRINDRLGHEAGDEVLKAIVRLVRERCRKLDMLFRQGGEEFLLLLPDTRAPEAMVVAENLRRAVAESKILPRDTVTVSVGVGEVRSRDTVKDWMNRVDDALYRAKGAGRNRVVAAEPRPVPSIAGYQRRSA